MRPIGSAEELERRRIRAVDLAKSGESLTTIARILGVDRKSLYRWRKMASSKPDGLKSIPHPGAPRQLNDTQLHELEYLLGQGSKAHGWPNELWTSKRIAELIRKQFGVDYHEGHVRKIVTKLLHWSSQKPERRARERDEDEIERWKRKDFPRIKKKGSGQGRNAGVPRRIRLYAQSHGPADLRTTR
jgi:transposase